MRITSEKANCRSPLSSRSQTDSPAGEKAANSPRDILVSFFSLNLTTAPHEKLEGNRLQEVVQHGKIVTLYSILRISGGQDEFGPVGRKNIHQFQARHAGHLNIQENQIGFSGSDSCQGLHRVLADRESLQVRHFTYIANDDVTGKGFVVDNDDAIRGFHVKSIFNNAWCWPFWQPM